MSVLLYVGIRKTLCMYHIKCSVTCTVFCDMLSHICGVMLCCIYYVTYVILCYICNVMVHALYKMHYVTCFATNI